MNRFLLLAALAACGGDDGLDENRSVTELSAAEATSLCKMQNELVDRDDYHHVLCMALAIGKPNCEALSAACEGDPSTAYEDVDCADTSKQWPACTEITVGVVEACYHGQVDAIAQLSTTLSCASSTADLTPLYAVPECAPLQSMTCGG